MFMLVVIFLPGGLMEGINRLRIWFGKRINGRQQTPDHAPATSS